MLAIECPDVKRSLTNLSCRNLDFNSAFLINSQDRIIRVFDSQIVLSCRDTEGAEPEPIQKLQDLVNR